jgi:hypothetical protein
MNTTVNQELINERVAEIAMIHDTLQTLSVDQNGRFRECSCLSRAYAMHSCYLCNEETVNTRCVNINCVDYVYPQLVQCDGCKFWKLL